MGINNDNKLTMFEVLKLENASKTYEVYNSKDEMIDKVTLDYEARILKSEYCYPELGKMFGLLDIVNSFYFIEANIM